MISHINQKQQHVLHELASTNVGRSSFVAVKFPSDALERITSLVNNEKSPKWAVLDEHTIMGFINQTENFSNIKDLNILMIRPTNWQEWDTIVEALQERMTNVNLFLVDNSMQAQYLADYLVWLDDAGEVVEVEATSDDLF
jgi:FtsZ-interacting cell division protein YlmF